VNVINIYDGAPNLTTPQRYLGLGVFSAERTDMRSLKSGDLFTVENCIPVRVVQIFTRSIASSTINNQQQQQDHNQQALPSISSSIHSAAGRNTTVS
jgi:hypothetical protein